MAWRVAKALEQLRSQFDHDYPQRDKSSDGTIAGDEHHKQNPKSDHEVDANGVVKALDISHDPARGCDVHKIADFMIQQSVNQRRLRYVISNKRIAGTAAFVKSNPRYGCPGPWAWGRYTGANDHTQHAHFSAAREEPLYDDTTEWALGNPLPQRPDVAIPRSPPTLRLGSQGSNVKFLQGLLGVVVDGDFGKQTLAAVKAFQEKAGIVADGIVGPYTWRMLQAETNTDSVQRGITATVFGGSVDAHRERSAYDNHIISDNELCVALPARFVGARPKVVLTAGDKTAIATIEDVGPWLTDDGYWNRGARPLAEVCHDDKRQLPRGPNSGRVPSNAAGIDLSPACARALGITGMGKVDWRFQREGEE